MRTGARQLLRGSNSGLISEKITYVRQQFYVGTSIVQQQKQPTEERPVLPGLSQEQIRKIGEVDTILRTRHMQIEAELTPAERDHARVSTASKHEHYYLACVVATHAHISDGPLLPPPLSLSIVIGFIAKEDDLP